jgi:hypothetical protein
MAVAYAAWGGARSASRCFAAGRIARIEKGEEVGDGAAGRRGLHCAV